MCLMATFVRSPVGGTAHNAKDKIEKNKKSFDREKFRFANFRFSKSEILKSDFFVRERGEIELFGIDERTKTSLSGSPALRLLLMPLSAGTLCILLMKRWSLLQPC
jgi:hypothetical protein